MNLKVIFPSAVFIDEEVRKITAEAENGSFCLLPLHVDFVAALVPGILSYVSSGGKEVFVAIDRGILVKKGGTVYVSTQNAVKGPDLGMLKETVDREFASLDERQKAAFSAMARLEAGFVRRFIELG
ncbi:MAG: F0F1 ATP synthase subunit epsilon [Nitrospirota bacterium]|nr:F0F1 ATP synthase subunit epsilon [Nitrospirota bacterium]